MIFINIYMIYDMYCHCIVYITKHIHFPNMKFLSEYEVWQWCITFRSHIHEAIYIYNLYICIRRPATPQQWEMLALYHLYTNPSDRGSKLHPGYTLHSNLFGGWQCILGGDFNYVVFSIQEIWLAFRMSESKPAVLIWAWPHNRCTKYSILYVCVCMCIYI